MGAGLYDPAMATLGRLYGQQARSAITLITLFGGLASTVCWPLSAFLVDAVGWRGTCAAYALIHLLVTLPLYLFGVPRELERHPASSRKARKTPGSALHRRRVLLALAAIGLMLPGASRPSSESTCSPFFRNRASRSRPRSPWARWSAPARSAAGRSRCWSASGFTRSGR